MEELGKLGIGDLIALKTHFSNLLSFHRENLHSSEVEYRTAVAQIKHLDNELPKIEALVKQKKVNFVKNKIEHLRYLSGIETLGHISNRKELDDYYNYLKFISEMIRSVHKENVRYQTGQRFLIQVYHETLLEIIWLINSRIYDKDTFKRLRKADELHFQTLPVSIHEIQGIIPKMLHQEICYSVVSRVRNRISKIKGDAVYIEARKIIREEYELDLDETNIKQQYYQELHKRNSRLKKKVKEVKEK